MVFALKVDLGNEIEKQISPSPSLWSFEKFDGRGLLLPYGPGELHDPHGLGGRLPYFA
ncbi:hypothetical protein [Geomesophilobacter sediminis]|uniref:Uncharacterized protein n=1 Tax=Geomesophilobacter sediminis TaxID=2798584 RepID=A0A8J7JB64_9BACT|nr:hypothetical protein [Geomesophilobacter sediminis]MBJ6723758.1 hypothetical protein [Geomesophilobacter sediminis]